MICWITMRKTEVADKAKYPLLIGMNWSGTIHLDLRPATLSELSLARVRSRGHLKRTSTCSMSRARVASSGRT